MDFNQRRVGDLYLKEPDGEGCFNKILYCSRIGATIGAYLCFHDFAVKRYPPKGFLPVMFRIVYICAHPVGCLATFAAVTCVATNLRKKDDQMNYIIGGAAAGAMLGIARQKFPVGFITGVLFSTTGYLIKDAQMNNYSLFEQRHYDQSRWLDRTLYINQKENVNE